MIEQTVVSDYNTFWLIIFVSIVIISIASILGIVIVKLKGKDNGLFNNIFNRHSDEHENTTDKMAKMHDNVIHLPYTNKQEKEFHSLETGLKELQEKVADLNDKVDILVKKVLILETKN